MLYILSLITRVCCFNFFAVVTIFLFVNCRVFAGNFDREPDAIINTNSLFDLPKDIVAAPVIKDLLTEDFVFYYREGGADWLSFRGTLARIAYEHNVDWPIKLMNWIMNGPAEVAFWRGPDGKLTNFMAVLDNTAILDFIKTIATVAVVDQQLTVIETEGRKVYTLNLASGKKIHLTFEESRIFIFTDLTMKIPDKALVRNFVERTKAFFGMNEDVSIFGPKLERSNHIITVSSQYLSFGYQSFFSSIKALRFDFKKGEGWSFKTLATDIIKKVDSENWKVVPRGAAFCLNLPYDVDKVSKIINVEKWLEKSSQSAIACWYPESKIYTPVFVLRGKYKEMLGKRPDSLVTIFENTIGVRGVSITSGENEGDPPIITYLQKYPVKLETFQNSQFAISREVGSRYGLYSARENDTFGSKRFFRTKLIATPSVLIFSPDDKLADKTLSTVNGLYPSMASSFPQSENNTIIVVSPDSLSKLIKVAILDSLPESQEAIFRTAISRHFFPNLDKFSKTPTQTAKIAGSGVWKDVQWSSHVVR